MDLPLRNVGPQIGPAELDAFQAEIGMVLPESYRNFLINQNGGFIEEIAEFEVDGKMLELVLFVPLECDPDSALRGCYTRLREEGFYPEGCLVIARASGEPNVCVHDVRLGGHMSIARYQYDVDEQPCKLEISTIAPSFEHFISSLQFRSGPYCPIRHLAKSGTEADLINLLESGKSIETISDDGNPILIEAIWHVNAPLVAACIKRGAKLNGSVSTATRVRSPEILDIVLAAGADPEEPDRDGYKPKQYIMGTALPDEFGERSRVLEAKLLRAIAEMRKRRTATQKRRPPRNSK